MIVSSLVPCPAHNARIFSIVIRDISATFKSDRDRLISLVIRSFNQSFLFSTPMANKECDKHEDAFVMFDDTKTSMCPLCKERKLALVFLATTKKALELDRLDSDYCDIVFDTVFQRESDEKLERRKIENRNAWKRLVKRLESSLREAEELENIPKNHT